MSNLTLIAALNAKDLGIGLNGTMPWHSSEEFKHFKEATLNKNIILGRKTFESIGRPLIDRHSIVITHDPKRYRLYDNNVTVVGSKEEALEAQVYKDTMVCGGATIYNLFADDVDKMILSFMNEDYACNQFFPRNYFWIGNNFNVTSIDYFNDFEVHTYEKLSTPAAGI